MTPRPAENKQGRVKRYILDRFAKLLHSMVPERAVVVIASCCGRRCVSPVPFYTSLLYSLGLTPCITRLARATE